MLLTLLANNLNFKNNRTVLFLSLIISTIFLHSCNDQENNTKKAFVPTKILNSGRIELRYGSYGIDVLENNDSIRVSNLYNTHKNNKITRTFAIVKYATKVDSSFLKEHNKIVQGQSIGIVFKQKNWTIEKRNIYFGYLNALNVYNKVYHLMGDIPPSDLAIRIYEFHIKKIGQSFNYATIAEVYHPDYLDTQKLKEIYKDEFKLHNEKNLLVSEYLKIVKQKLKM